VCDARSQAAIVFGMGFATNALSLPGLLGPGVLALSDENNHASLILGLRLARATVRVFRHNDLRHLERLARAAIAEGCWTKIVIVSTRLLVPTVTLFRTGKTFYQI
jgi:serine palmitoyltransferase